VGFRPGPGTEEELRALVAVETRCCPWAAWTVHADATELVLDVRSANEGIAALHAMFTGLRPPPRPPPAPLPPPPPAPALPRAAPRPTAAPAGKLSVPQESGIPAVLMRASPGLAERAVHRSVQPRLSRQYQRTSVQALPPSATMWSAGRRIPHSQQGWTG